MNYILLVNTYFYPHYGGVETTLYHISKTLIKYNYQPIILTSNRGTIEGTVLNAFEELEGIQIYRYPLPKRKWVLNIYSIFDEIYQAKKLATEIFKKFEIFGILARSHLSGLGVLNVKKDIPILYIPSSAIWLHNEKNLINRSGSFLKKFLRDINSNLQLPIHTLFQKKIVKKSEHVWVFSKIMSENFKSIQKSGMFKVRYPGVDSIKFKPIEPSKKKEKKEQLNLNINNYLALCMCRLTPHKNVEIIVEAFRKIPNESEWELIIVGDGPEENILKNLVIKYGLINKVSFYPPTKHPELWYSIADVFLMTSVYESFGQTLLEAQASGLPVIGFARDDSNKILNANSEIIEDGKTGWIISYGAENLAQILQVIEKREKYNLKEFSLNARNHSILRFSWDEFCKDLIVVFSK